MARTIGRTPAPADLRGGRCHCPPGLPLHLVHSEAIRESCDFVVDAGSNVRGLGRKPWPPSKLGAAAASLGPGSTVHVKTDNLADFAREVLPALRSPIVLVTGDSDRSPVLRHRDLLGHPMIAHWFVQNCDLEGRHPRLTRIPIGIDNPVLTKLEKRLGFAATALMGLTPADWTATRNDMGDQAVLQDVRARLAPSPDRPLRVLCTFHQNQKLITPDISGMPDRREAFAALSGRPWCHVPDQRLLQRECWEAHGQFAFEASPQGNGLDCFRTWEALFLGTIPIVRRSTLNPLYEDESLPVAVVGSWEEVTPEALGDWHARLSPLFGPALDARLCAGHWIGKIRASAKSVLESAGGTAAGAAGR
ncbi:MAG TPA: hypothetical protein VGG34_16035 [Opitutaceae bacterium]